MAYFIDLFSPETYQAFTDSKRDVSGFRDRHRKMAERIKPGDCLVCYVTRLSRWVGLLDVIEGPFIDHQPIFVPENDPFIVRFRVKASTWLDLEHAIPIHDKGIWERLSFTKDLHEGSLAWTGKVRGSLVRLDEEDGGLIAAMLQAQVKNAKRFPLDDQERRKLATHTVVRSDKVVSVSVPDDSGSSEEVAGPPEVEGRESTRIQALLAMIGEQMGMSVWIPKADRNAVLREWRADDRTLLDRLPLNYDDTTLRTIEQIDVLWLRRRSIVNDHQQSSFSERRPRVVSELGSCAV